MPDLFRPAPLVPLDAWLAGRLPEKAEALPIRVREAQLAALRNLLPYVTKHSAFYAGHFAGHDTHIPHPEDFEGLPFTEAEHLRDWQKFLCVSHSRVQRMVSLNTSGTTGPPKRLAFTENDLALTRDFFRVGLSELIRPGERLGVLLPGGGRPDGVADQLRLALSVQNIAVECLPQSLESVHDGPNAATLADWIRWGKFHCLVTMPNHLHALLTVFPERPRPLRGVLSSADALAPELAQAVRKAWACDVRNHYGLTESGFGLAVECACHNGLHLRELDILVEIVDVEKASPVPPGVEGEVVITTLRHEAMPLVRYRTGDVSCLLPGPCRCGSPMPRLGPIAGRLQRDSEGSARLARLPKSGILSFSPTFGTG
ncbi:MAG: AMP-binding protein [Desulfovibrio sp.]|jgi:phenylacetate-coenzyme A ligase PaaK-like adenylate-forming protein|nr:AMP-binding protein [Desulfovibrio sp.]